MKAFLTGSRVYGTPKEDSDWDLVVFMDQTTVAILVGQFGAYPNRKENPEEYLGAAAQFKVGNINLILVSDPAHYTVWELGTALLTAIKPCTREEAVKMFAKLREKKEKHGEEFNLNIGGLIEQTNA